MPTTRRSAIAEKAPCTWVQARWKFRSGSKTPSTCPDNQIRSKLDPDLTFTRTRTRDPASDLDLELELDLDPEPHLAMHTV